MADPLHERYMKATRAHQSHEASCSTCLPGTRCAAGERLYESFARLQDAYLAQQRKRG
ncbi:hypothetical protein [Streptomyces sp. NPDC006552]|uniref:hypothetical protein n=1 Tax=Streptomyces sp. NPDC006552 TaxID=3157179 RepID=UPI00339F987D